MIRQAISPRLAMSREVIIVRLSSSARRPPLAAHRPGPAASADREPRRGDRAVARLVRDRAASLANRDAVAAADLGAAVGKVGELRVADPADGAPRAGPDHELTVERSEEHTSELQSQ